MKFNEKITATSNVFKVLSNPTRLKIIILLIKTPKILCVNEIVKFTGVTQSAISHQLAKLAAWKIVNYFRQGQSICYEILKNNTTNKI